MTPQYLPHTNAPCVVLDTNAVLDWQLFQDPRFARLGGALARGDVRWVASTWMMNELRFMLTHSWPSKWNEKSKHLLEGSIWEQAELVTPPGALPAHRLTCTDPDDQAFLDLALNLPARWLVTRDKALLKLARRAASSQLTILRPEDWTPIGP